MIYWNVTAFMICTLVLIIQLFATDKPSTFKGFLMGMNAFSAIINVGAIVHHFF